MDKLISLIVAGVMIALPAVMQAEPAIQRPFWIRQVTGDDILVQAAAPGRRSASPPPPPKTRPPRR